MRAGDIENKRQELADTLMALLDIGVAPDDDVRPLDEQARPDHEFEHCGRTIALEVTRALPQSLGRERKLRTVLRDAVLELLCRENHPVWVHMSVPQGTGVSDYVGRAKDRGFLTAASTIAGLARGVLARSTEGWFRFRDDGLAGAVGPVGLDFLPLLSIQRWREPLVTLGGTPFPLTQALVQERVDEKNKKLAKYRGAGAHEYWLLVVADDGPDGFVDFSGLEGATFSSQFDRTFVLERFTKRCVEVTGSFELKLQLAGEVASVVMLDRSTPGASDGMPEEW